MQPRFGIAATRSALRSLKPLLRARPGAVVCKLLSRDVGHADRWRGVLDEVDGLLVVGRRETAPRSALPGILARDRHGRPVVLSLLPDVGPEGLSRFARAAVAVQARPEGVGPVALLSQWERRALFMVRRTERALARRSEIPFVRWSGERVRRNALLAGLGAGPGLTLYFGHGRSVGWVGYSGLRSRHLGLVEGEPGGLVVSAACDTASRRNVGLSFTEAWVTRGRAVAAVGAVEATSHLLNRRWMRRLCGALTDGASTVDEVVRAAFADEPDSASSYRLIGDPIAPMRGAADAWTGMLAVDAPGPRGGAVVERHDVRVLDPAWHRQVAAMTGRLVR